MFALLRNLLRKQQRPPRARPRRAKSRLSTGSPCARLAGQALEERRLLALTGQIELPTVTAGLSWPVTATHAGDGSGRLFIAEQGGWIRTVQNGALHPTPFLDLSQRVALGDEQGLLGLAFHPDFAVPGAFGQGKFYVYYSAPATVAGTHHDSVISEFRVSPGDPNLAELVSERVVLRFSQPFYNHNGGDLKFGPDDGLLYISSGDGGSGSDPQNNAQNRSTLLGKILRIDVNGNNGPTGQYGIPATNPFVGQSGVREEIFAYGFRNPFRMSFDDGLNGAASPDRLFVGDVGQSAWEEVDLVTAGGNYGWRLREGAHPFNTTDPQPGNLIDPIAEYPNPTQGQAVIGGFVYRGDAFPTLRGFYIFADLTGRIFVLEEPTRGQFELSEPNVAGGNPIGSFVLGFGEDEAGELYLLTPDSLRRVTVDSLPLPTPWRNPNLPADVNDDTRVNLVDLQMMVAFLRDNGLAVDLAAPDDNAAPPPYYDPSGDDRATTADLLVVVNHIREQILASALRQEEDRPALEETIGLVALDRDRRDARFP